MDSRGDEFNKKDDVVITGISGVFPRSENIEEFKENLFSGEELYSDNNRWSIVGEKTQKIGMLKTLDRFDHAFFRVSRRQSETMNISGRIILEKVFEAILDSGYNPEQFRGTNTAVYLGFCYDDKEQTVDHTMDTSAFENSDLTVIRSIMASRISYWLDARGPCVLLDSACATSLYAVEMAYRAIQNGSCDAAIVGTVNLCVMPHVCTSSANLGITSKEGHCRPFDAEADGFIRAEAIVAIVLQKRSDARRIYANIIHAKTNNDGFTEEGLMYPSLQSHVDLFQQFYREIEIDPQHVSFIEAHGTGTRIGDPIEVEAIEKFFCANRTTPLNIGSVKSNMGHGEASAGLCGIAKMIIAFETGKMPPTINYKTPNPKIDALLNGNIQIATTPLPCEGGYYAVNSYGLGGSNAHVLLSPFNKRKTDLPSDSKSNDLPRLVTASGRTEEAVDVILKDVEKNCNDVEYIRLIHEIFSEEISGHLYRGYSIVNINEENKKEVKFISGERRPIWFIFTGMGSQWPAMGKCLMRIPIFAESIHKSHKLLQTKGLDLIKIIEDDDPAILENILNSFVGIAAIQIALVDILRAIGIQPDGIIGHSLGELGCAYADECFTAEQMLLCAYYRGLVSIETEFIHGTMAAVGTSSEDIKKLVPPEIDVAAHNSSTSSTISGPTDIVNKFVAQLKEKEIFVREVNTSNIPYHSRYIVPAGPKFISCLKEIIPVAKPRSEKWICTSLPESEWTNDNAKYSSAEYHTNNLLNPVYFEEGSHHIPDNAIAIEIAPHGLLQAILKRSLPSSVDNIPLTLRSSEDGVKFLLNAMGQIYVAGGTPKLSTIYPPVEFPVSRGTPMISPLIRWQHEEQWPLNKYAKENISSGERDVFIDLKSEEYRYLRDHVVDGRNLFPAMGYLYLVWEAISSMQKMKSNEVSVIFENIRFLRATNILKTHQHMIFHISIQKSTGNFEILENNAAVVTGVVRLLMKVDAEWINVAPTLQGDSSNVDDFPLLTKDFYKLLRLKGYHYKGLFKKVVYANHDGIYGKVSWCNNFVTFMDTMAQLMILQKDVPLLMVPTYIRKLIIDVKRHNEIISTLNEETPELPVQFYPHIGLLCSGGVQIVDLDAKVIPRSKTLVDPVLEKYQFVPYINEEKMDTSTAVSLCTHIALENNPSIKVKTIELLDEDYKSENELISNLIAIAIADLPAIQADINVLTDSQESFKDEDFPNIKISNEKLPTDNSCSMIILTDLSKKANLLNDIFVALQNHGSIVSIESTNSDLLLEQLGLIVCFSRHIDDDKRILLLRKNVERKPNCISIRIENDSYSWISEMQKTLESIKSDDNTESNTEVIVYSQKESLSGILGFFNCLRIDERSVNLKCFFSMDENAPTFSLQHELYRTQHEKNLSHNVYKNGEWGSYRHLKLQPTEDKEVTYAYCTQLTHGDLSSFRWVEGSLNSSDGRSIYVYYSPLNFRDLMIGVGNLIDRPGGNHFTEPGVGFEFGGKFENGERCIGFVGTRGVATMINSDLRLGDYIWRVPDHMTLEEASTIPIVYTTVVYALLYQISLRKGCSILIHAGSGGVGQAAINICTYYGCEIFTTVGTPEKVEYIKNTFPQIPENHIGDSRSTSFENLIMERTNGRGVDVVLNSLAGELLRASLRCVAKGGDFIELGKFDMVQNNLMEMKPFLKSIRFHGIYLDDTEVIPLDRCIDLQKRIQNMLDEGIIKPIRSTVFNINEVESAVRYMAAAKHIGKVMIKIRNEEDDIYAKPSPIYFPAQARLICEADKSYVIIGGLGGFGLELTHWLISRGAKNIVLSSRTGLKNGYQSYKIDLWRALGITIVISTHDVTTEIGVKDLLYMANTLGPISAIFNVAVILKDGPFDKQTEESFRTSAGPKAIATLHLDKLSRQMCPHLQHFVLFSSVSCGRGNQQQTNYGMSNSIMERICETRQADNLPALVIQWGAIGEVGIVADLAEDNVNVVIGGTLQQKVKSCLETLDTVLHQDHPIVSSIVVAEKRRHDSDIINSVANILGIRDLKTISLTWTLPELGMDSLSGVEIKQLIESEFGIFLTPEDMKSMTFGKLYAMKEEKKSPGKGGGKYLTQYQSLLKEKFINSPILRIPLDGDIPREEVSVHDNPTVFVFPGIEGIAKLMEPLAKKLSVQVLCFQYHSKIPKNSVQEVANYFASLITERLDIGQKYRIVGYSLGAIILLDVIKILESQGLHGCVWLIDGAPEYLKRVGKLYKGNDLSREEEEEDMQYSICMKLLRSTLVHGNINEYAKRIQATKGWQAKVELCSSMVPEKFEKLTTREILENALCFSKLHLRYEFETEPLDTACTLIRCPDEIVDLDDSYGLSKYFKQLVRVYKIDDTDHYSIIQHEKVAEIIMNDPTWE